MKISSLSCLAAILLSCSSPSTYVAAQESSVRGGTSGLPIEDRTLEDHVLLAEVDLGDNGKASFYKTGDGSIVLKTITPHDGGHNDRLLRLLQDEDGTEEEQNPVSLYGRLQSAASGVEGGADTDPPEELVAAWETVQSHRAEKQSATGAAGTVLDVSNQEEFLELPESYTHADESDVDPENRRLLTNPWWTSNYCRAKGLIPSICLCSHYLTGNYISSVSTSYSLKFHVGVAKGSVRQTLYGRIGSKYYTISYQTVSSGRVGTIYTWTAYKYDRVYAYVTYAAGDVYHASFYAMSSSYGYNTCKAGY